MGHLSEEASRTRKIITTQFIIFSSFQKYRLLSTCPKPTGPDVLRNSELFLEFRRWYGVYGVYYIIPPVV